MGAAEWGNDMDVRAEPTDVRFRESGFSAALCLCSSASSPGSSR